MPAKANRIPPRSKQSPREDSLASAFSQLWDRRKRSIAGIVLFLIALTVFWPAIENDFVGYDDPDYVTGNPHIRQLNWETVQWAFTNTEVTAWHPLAWLSHAVDCQLYGLEPWGHHLSSVLLHAFNALLCFLVLSRMTGAVGRSWVVAALFALHPLRVESVAWVSERKDVLSMAFLLLALLAYERYVRSCNAPKTFEPATPSNFRWNNQPPFYFFLCLILFAFGLMSKPMLVTFPFILLLLDVWPLRRFESSSAAHRSDVLRRVLLEKSPFLLLALLVSVVTIIAQPKSQVSAVGAIPIQTRLENAPVFYCRYLAKCFWPAKLAPFYPPVEHWPGPVWGGAALLLLGASVLAVYVCRRRPFLTVGWLWFLVTLVPVIGVVQVGEQSIADRYMYLPSIGLLVAVVWGVATVFPRTRYRAAALALMTAVLLAICVSLTTRQIGMWKNSETLFQHTLVVTSGNYLAHNNLGVVLDQQGRTSEATDEFEQALKIKPGYADALKNMAIVLHHQGRSDKAEEFFKAALRQKPDLASALNGLGLLYQEQGKDREAEQQFREALKVKPDYADAHFNLALELERAGDLAQAEAELKSTLKLQPNSADAHSNLGVLLEKQGRLDAAIQEYTTAVRLNPDFARGWFNLGVGLSRKGFVDDAIGAFETALRLKPDYAAAQTNLNTLKAVRR